MKLLNVIVWCLPVIAPANAEQVYKYVDEDGVTTFSDTGTPGSKIIEVREPITFSNAAVMEQAERHRKYAIDGKPGKSMSIRYSDLKITKPPNGSAIRDNAGRLTLAVSVVPDFAEGHEGQLMMDGRVVRNIQGSGPVSLSNIDRGTHEFRIRVVDKWGREVNTGPSTSISVLRYSPPRKQHH